ncbi:protein asteroid [Onthophagus taurus]|uniref:protein asteroid n=1 Tax=Onthophagus taurus TaxID=166361 RepID=UPI000C2020B7|nr:protein asteroid [Onthophagus taurus]
MGVRGLTTFIAQSSNRYIKPYELHDTYLVIDGNNLAAQLYKWHAKCYDCFGGDYDKYEKTVIYFFKLLKECNITPLIIYDGGYEDRKLKTVYQRVKARLLQAKTIDAARENGMSVFPLFLRELFVEITLKLELKVVRCLVEADYEMACIARKLNCPVLSYDSDFFIFDVAYIPFNTIVMHGSKSRANYKYVECKIYRVDYFLREYGGIKKECLPLLATLLGNDYIKASVFNNFYKHLKLGKRNGKNDQQRRIKAVIEWLRNEDFESALRKILGRVKQFRRKYVGKQIMGIANSYVCSDSELIKFLDIEENNKDKKSKTIIDDINIDAICDESAENNEEVDSEDESSDDSSSDESPEAEKVMKPDDSRQIDELPKYFEVRYQKCVYPATFIDIIFHNRYIFVPQIEDFCCNIPSHNISLELMKAIYKMLALKNTKKLKYINRNIKGKIDSFFILKSPLDLPNINELENLSLDEAKKYFYLVLNIDKDLRTQNIINDFPADWKLYVSSIIYWIKWSKPPINNCYIYALILTALILQFKVGYFRDERKFYNSFTAEIKEIEKNTKELTINNKISNEEALKLIARNDEIMTYKEIITYFHMNIKLRRNPNLYDKSIIHGFAQFQSCAYHIKYLNCLLGKPFDDYLISKFYNGTLIYNLTMNFLTRRDLDAYLRLFLKNSPGVYAAFTKIKVSIALCSDVSWTTNERFKRKRKRNRSGFNIFKNDKEGDAADESDDDVNMEHCDENNRFSLLSIVDGQ